MVYCKYSAVYTWYGQSGLVGVATLSLQQLASIFNSGCMWWYVQTDHWAETPLTCKENILKMYAMPSLFKISLHCKINTITKKPRLQFIAAAGQCMERLL